MDFKLIFFLSLVIFFQNNTIWAESKNNLTQNTKKIKPSSKIPEKREFPLSEDVNPCSNFHSYVCKKVEESFVLRPDRRSHTFAFSDSAEKILERKKEFLKNIKNEGRLTPRAQQIKDTYLACMNVGANKKEEKLFVQRYIQDIQKINTLDDFLAYEFALNTSMYDGLLSIGEINSSNNPDILDLYLSISFMGLPDHSYYENKELIKDYKKLNAEFFKIVYPKLSKAKIDQKVEAMYEFEKRFVDIYPKPEVRRQRFGEKRDMSQVEFIKKYPSIGVQPYLKLIPQTINPRILFPEAFDFYQAQMEIKNLPVLKDILLARLASGLMDDAYPKYYNSKFEFRKKYFGGPDQRPVRAERCTFDAMGTFAKEFDQLLIDRFFPNFPYDKMDQVITRVRASILDGIDKNDWLSRSAKTEARKKIETCRLQIGVPKTEKEWDFADIQVLSSDEPINNKVKLGAAAFKKMLKTIQEPANKDSWGMGPLTVNAYFSPVDNKFVMPLGILQYPFFVADGDIIENLGAVGSVVGHELGHAIDDQGSKFDHKGQLRQWMDMNDLARFKEKGSRMVEQFAKAGHNGQLTLGENVADLVGLSFAYHAAFPKNEGSVEDKKKFFVAYARTWCEVKRPGVIESHLKTDPHALGWARINEQVKHQKAFAEAFACKPNDPMVLPDNELIKIW